VIDLKMHGENMKLLHTCFSCYIYSSDTTYQIHLLMQFGVWRSFGLQWQHFWVIM